MNAILKTATERRDLPRQRTLLRGRVLYGENASISVDCTIRNLTAKGALLLVPDDQPLPAEFTLMDVTEGISFEAHLIWRRANMVGVTLGDRHDLKSVVEAQLRSLREIWMALAPR